MPYAVEGRIDDDLYVVLPSHGEVLLQHRDRVEIGGWGEDSGEDLDGGDPVDAVRAPGTGGVRPTQQVPPTVADHDCPRIDLGHPLRPGLGAVAQPHPSPAR